MAIKEFEEFKLHKRINDMRHTYNEVPRNARTV